MQSKQVQILLKQYNYYGMKILKRFLLRLYLFGLGVEQLKKPGESEIQHYVRVIKEHGARRASFNERMEYWRKYHERTTDQSSKDAC